MLITDETIDEYHGNPALSHGQLRDFSELGPRGFFLRHVRREAPRPSTKALRAGRAFETYLFEPQVFEEWFAAKPEDYSGRTNKWKDWCTEQELSGKIIVDRDDFLAFEHMRSALDECASARALLETGIYQPTWRIGWHGLPGVQSRPDFGNMEGCARSEYRPYTLDVKTTRKLAGLVSGRDVVTYGYHTQAATARIASELPECIHYLLAFEKAFPCRAMVLEVSREFVNIGEDWAMGELAKIAEHYESDYWPLTVSDSAVVEPPVWLLRQHDARFEADVEQGEAVEPEQGAA